MAARLLAALDQSCIAKLVLLLAVMAHRHVVHCPADAVKSSADAAAREQLAKVVEVLVADKVASFDDCVAWARLKFQDYFHDRIAQLTYTFPEDAITSTGAPFWSAPKRFPHPVKFDAADPAHASFMQVRAADSVVSLVGGVQVL